MSSWCGCPISKWITSLQISDPPLSFRERRDYRAYATCVTTRPRPIRQWEAMYEKARRTEPTMTRPQLRDTIVRANMGLRPPFTIHHSSFIMEHLSYTSSQMATGTLGVALNGWRKFT